MRAALRLGLRSLRRCPAWLTGSFSCAGSGAGLRSRSPSSTLSAARRRQTHTSAPPSRPRSPAVWSADVDDLKRIETAAETIVDAQAVIDAATVRRDEAIAAARREGYPWARIATAARLSRQGARDAAMRANGGVVPEPRQRG